MAGNRGLHVLSHPACLCRNSEPDSPRVQPYWTAVRAARPERREYWEQNKSIGTGLPDFVPGLGGAKRKPSVRVFTQARLKSGGRGLSVLGPWLAYERLRVGASSVLVSG